MEIVFASSNKHKLKEISNVAIEYGIKIISISEITDRLKLDKFQEPEENGNSYQENSFIKAMACYSWCNLPSIGDDSGLNVDILEGAPGIYSARYAGEKASDKDRISKLLNEVNQKCLENKNNNRSARFCCHLSLIINKQTIYNSEGILEGEILTAPRGSHGFGYDPIVLINEFGATLAEIEEETLYKAGFRAKAAKKLFESLKHSQIN